MKLTRQQLFDAALFGIRNQQYRPSVRVDSTGSKSCAYLAGNGDRCAVGHALPPDTPEEVLTSAKTVLSLHDEHEFVAGLIDGEDLPMVLDLQNLHDYTLRMQGAEEWERGMQRVSIVYSVVYTPKEV